MCVCEVYRSINHKNFSLIRIIRQTWIHVVNEYMCGVCRTSIIVKTKVDDTTHIICTNNKIPTPLFQFFNQDTRDMVNHNNGCFAFRRIKCVRVNGYVDGRVGEHWDSEYSWLHQSH